MKLEDLDKLDKIGRDRKRFKIGKDGGYTLNQNSEVNGLMLKDCEIRNLNRIISPLKKLNNLTTLNLTINQLADISPLKDLTNLTTLDLTNNQLTDISPLKEVMRLETLILNYNKIEYLPS